MSGPAGRARAVIFDFYDTLAELSSGPIEANRRELARLAGVEPEEWAPLWRASSRERTLGTAGDMAAQIRTMLEQLGKRPAAALVEELVAREYQAWHEAVRLYAGGSELLRRLRAEGYRLAILSNCSCQAGWPIRSHGLEPLVDTLVLSYEVGVAKPDPAIYQAALERLEVDARAAAYVADGAGGELEAAKALGLRSIKVHHPGSRHPDDPTVQADYRVRSLGEVADLLEQ